MRYSERYNFKTLASDINDYILQNFTTVRHQSEFKNLQKEALIQYLSRDELNTAANETEVLHAIKDWLDQDEGRIQYAQDLIQNVRFMSINMGKLLDIAKMDLIDDRKICRNLVRSALEYQYDTFSQPLATLKNRPRGNQGICVISGGRGKTWISDVPNRLYKSLSRSGTLLCSDQDMNEKFVRHSMLMTQINNFLFLFATKVVNEDDNSMQAVSLRYDVGTDQWLELASIPNNSSPTVGSSLARIGDEIFLISGMHISQEAIEYCLDKSFSYDMLKYSITKNLWEAQKEIPTAMFASAATGYALNSCVFVSGGYTQDMDKVLDLVWAYDTKTDHWLSKPPMNHARGDHLMEAVGDKIYVLGGQNRCLPVLQIEKYDIVSEQWTDIAGQSLNVIDSFSVVSDTNIFILGGAKRGKGYKPMKSIRFLDTRSEHLIPYDVTLAEPVTAHVAAFVTFPKMP